MRSVGTALAFAGALAAAACQESADNTDPSAQAAAIRAEMAAGNYGKAGELATQAVKAHSSDPELHLLQAHAEARLGNAGNAVRALDRAILAGLSDPGRRVEDAVFDGIRGDASFQKIATRYEKAPALPAGPPEDAELRAGDVEITDDAIRAGDLVLDAN